MNAGTDTKRLRALAAMGIDVWVRRSRHARVDHDAARDARTEEGSRVVVSTAPPPIVEMVQPAAQRPVDVPVASWTAVAVGATVLLARIDAPHDRRFASDLVLASAGYPAETPAIVSFTPTRADGEEIAAFARGQMNRRRAAVAIVSRGAATALGLEIGDSGVTQLNGVRCIVIPEIAALRANPDAKRNVWRTLSPPR